MNGTLVVLHGWGQSKDFWKQFASRFNEGEVILVDLPGFGDEPLIDVEWGIPEYVAWTEEKIAALKRDNIILMGHSFGGRIAGAIAAHNPSWLSALILYAAPCLYRPERSMHIKIAAAKFLKKIGVRNLYNNEELKEADRMGLGTIFRKIVIFDETEMLPNIAVPTLLVWGGKDTYPPLSMGQEMHALISGSTLSIMESEGHNAHLENPTLFYGIIKKFIDTL